MSLNSILVLIGLIVFFTVAIALLAKNGGWQKGGCNGDCSSCASHCADDKHSK